jgi:hypothetical protein
MLPPWLSIVAPKYGPDAAVPLNNKAEETALIVEIAGKSYPIRTLCGSSTLGMGENILRRPAGEV